MVERRGTADLHDTMSGEKIGIVRYKITYSESNMNAGKYPCPQGDIKPVFYDADPAEVIALLEEDQKITLVDQSTNLAFDVKVFQLPTDPSGSVHVTFMEGGKFDYLLERLSQ